MWSLEDSMLLPGETLFTPLEAALARGTRLCEALHAGLLLALVLLLSRLAGASSASFLGALAPVAPDLRLAQYTLACLALVGAAYQSLAARAWVRGVKRSATGSEALQLTPPPPPALAQRARYQLLAALAHAVVVVTIMASLPFDNTLRVAALKAAAAAQAAGATGYSWEAVGTGADAAIASWKVLVFLRFVAAASALALSTMASLSPAEAANVFFQST